SGLPSTTRTVHRAFQRFACVAIALAAVPAHAQTHGVPVPLTDRARGAERVVVGRIASVTPMWRVNGFGDRLIVSVAHVAVDETLKGDAQPAVDVEIEGGTIGTLTLHVSDQDAVAPGDRAVFYLARNRSGTLVPHLRGQGLLKLDRTDHVPHSS